MQDKLIRKLIAEEKNRQYNTLDLIPSENMVSKETLNALGSIFTNKYAEGYPGARYYCGNEYVDKLENLCRNRALELFNLSPDNWAVNVQPYSGSPANLAVYFALASDKDFVNKSKDEIPKIMGMRLDMGGHLTHGQKVSITGRFWKSVLYGVDEKTEMLNYKEIAEMAKIEKPKIIVAGFTAYPRIIDFKKFREIANSVNAYLMVDMSHFSGLVASNVYPSPFLYADVVTTTTHKSLRGPRGAMIFSNRKSKIGKNNNVDIAKAIDKAIMPGLQGGPHMNQIASVAVALKEAKTQSFKKYGAQIVKNAKAMAEEFEKLGWRLISGGTNTHLLLIDVAQKGIGGKEASERLEAQGIILNKNMIPYDKRTPNDPSGIRIGTPALTTRGMKEKDMKIIAKLINDSLLYNKNIKKDVLVLCKKYKNEN